MPQLDIFTFYSQYFWFLLIFLIIYFRVVGFYLPDMAVLLKLRSKIKSLDSVHVDTIKLEHEGLVIVKNNLLKDCFLITSGQLGSFLDKSFVVNDKLFQSYLESNLSSSNDIYLQSVLNLYVGKFITEEIVLDLKKS